MPPLFFFQTRAGVAMGVQAIGYTLDESSHGENLMNSFQARLLRLFLSWPDHGRYTIATVSEAFGDFNGYSW